MTTTISVPKVRALTRQEGKILFDQRARAELKISGATFVKRWKAGKYAKKACRPEVMRVAMLLPFAR